MVRVFSLTSPAQGIDAKCDKMGRVVARVDNAPKLDIVNMLAVRNIARVTFVLTIVSLID